MAYAEPAGYDRGHFLRAVVGPIRAELAVLPRMRAVAIHLSGHGLATTTCGSYDCGADSYHWASPGVSSVERRGPASQASIDRPGRTGVFHVYGGASG